MQCTSTATSITYIFLSLGEYIHVQFTSHQGECTILMSICNVKQTDISDNTTQQGKGVLVYKPLFGPMNHKKNMRSMRLGYASFCTLVS